MMRTSAWISPVAFYALIGCATSYKMVAFGSAEAHETSGAPTALIGTFGKSPEQCRSYNRKTDDMSVIERDHYTFCGGSGCEARITSARKTPTGYRLSLVGTFSSTGWTADFREISPDIFEVRSDSDPRVETIIRCTSKDIEAGIGRSVGPDGLTRALSAAFAAYYAETVPSLCPAFRIDAAVVRKLLDTAVNGWEAHLRRYNLAPVAAGKTFREGVERDVERQKPVASAAAQRDFKDLPTFCEAVERAFGPEGQVMPGVLIDPRKKADALTSNRLRAG